MNRSYRGGGSGKVVHGCLKWRFRAVRFGYQVFTAAGRYSIVGNDWREQDLSFFTIPNRKPLTHLTVADLRPLLQTQELQQSFRDKLA